MANSYLSGPIVVFGQQATPTEYNLDACPSMFYQGTALLDPRPQFGYQAGSAQVTTGFWCAPELQTVNVVPAALAANNIAASQTPTADTALTLVSTTGAGVTAAASLFRSDTGAAVTGLLALDGPSARLMLGQSQRNALWDPTTMLTRNVRITSAGNDSGATFTVRGYDAYWFPMTEVITGANAGVAEGKKAFKYIASITPAGTLGGTGVTVGTGDVIGFPIRADAFGDVLIVWNNGAIVASTGFIAAVTAAATGTTGDVRGTYALQSASDGSKRLHIYQSPQLANVLTVTGMFGQTQFSG